MRGWLRYLIALTGTCALLLGGTAPAAADGPATISISPTSGPPGTSITVTGENWTLPSWAGGVSIDIDQNYGNGNLKQLGLGNSGPPDRNGSFSAKVTIPTSAEPGLITITALTGGGYAPTASFTATGAGQPAPPTLEVDKAFTTGGTTTEKTAFKPGDPVWYVVSMTVKNGPARATVQWRATGSKVIYDFTSSPSDINTGYQAPYGPSTIPTNAPSGTYTLTAYVTFNGSTTIRTSTFTVSTHGAGTGGGLYPRCMKSQTNRENCNEAIDLLLEAFTHLHVSIKVVKPLIDGCRAGDEVSCQQLQAKADSLGIS